MPYWKDVSGKVVFFDPKTWARINRLNPGWQEYNLQPGEQPQPSLSRFNELEPLKEEKYEDPGVKPKRKASPRKGQRRKPGVLGKATKTVGGKTPLAGSQTRGRR